jgi:hypothetical protein
MDFTSTKGGLQGYCWDFPVNLSCAPESASRSGQARPCEQPAFNRGVYEARVATSRPRAPLPQLLQGFLGTLGDDSQSAEVEGHPMHWFSPRNRLSWPRLLLVGTRWI